MYRLNIAPVQLIENGLTQVVNSIDNVHCIIVQDSEDFFLNILVFMALAIKKLNTRNLLDRIFPQEWNQWDPIRL